MLMKKSRVFLMVLLLVLLVSCIKQEQEEIAEIPMIRLSELEGSYELADFTDFGLYVLTINADAVKGMLPMREQYCLESGSGQHEIRTNPLDTTQLMAFLPENYVLTELEQAKITLATVSKTIQKRTGGALGIEYVYITKDGTLYELTLIDYLFMKNVRHAFIMEEGTLLRPTHVKTNEGNAYTLQRYYNARQAAETHTVDGAFAFLKLRPNHQELLNTENPSRVKIENGNPVVSEPDTRDRVRDLGEMGPIDADATYTYDVVDDTVTSLTLKIKESNLPEVYKGFDQYEIQLKDDATICYLRETEPGIFESVIQYETTKRVELVKNARFAISTFSGGEGTSDDPYQISNWKQLAAINDEPEYLEAHYVLIADLASDTVYYDEYAAASANEDAGWIPIGGTTVFKGSFSGSHEGTRYTIDDLVVNKDTSYAGLFGMAEGATLTEITLENASITNTGGYTGGLAGFLANTYVATSNVSGDVNGGTNVGLLSGFINGGNLIENCYTDGTVTGSGIVGGFAGYVKSTTAYTDDTLIKNCYSLATATGNSFVGGFVGAMDTGGYISNCYATDKTTDIFSGTGLNGSITNSFWLSEITGTDNNGATSKTAAEMIQETTFNGWDFTNIWRIDERASFPYLKSNTQDPKPGNGLLPAVVLEVTGGALSGYDNITAALAQVDATTPVNATLTLNEAEYKEAGDMTITLTIGRTITIKAGSGVQPVIDGEDARRLFKIASYSKGMLNFEGVVLQNGNGGGAGRDSLGAAIAFPANSTISQLTLNIDFCEFKNNASGGGSALFVSSGGILEADRNIIRITNSTITNNTAYGSGGGINVLSSNSYDVYELSNVVISGNSASGSGGGIDTSVRFTTNGHLWSSTDIPSGGADIAPQDASVSVDANGDMYGSGEGMHGAYDANHSVLIFGNTANANGDQFNLNP